MFEDFDLTLQIMELSYYCAALPSGNALRHKVTLASDVFHQVVRNMAPYRKHLKRTSLKQDMPATRPRSTANWYVQRYHAATRSLLSLGARSDHGANRTNTFRC